LAQRRCRAPWVPCSCNCSRTCDTTRTPQQPNGHQWRCVVRCCGTIPGNLVVVDARTDEINVTISILNATIQSQPRSDPHTRPQTHPHPHPHPHPRSRSRPVASTRHR
jgi:hypothetical protein